MQPPFPHLMKTMARLLEPTTLRSLLAPRPRDSHKGLFGSVAILGGAPGMVGATLLAGRAALKLGAGSVHIGLLADNAPAVDTQQPELMLHPARQVPAGNVIAIGCGLGDSMDAQKLLHDILKREVPMVLDADALNLLAARPDLRSSLTVRNAATVLTPHPGEAARLLHCGTDEVQADRAAAALRLFDRFGCALVLKGADSLVVDSSGVLHKNTSGNPGMSGPGMGDVLTGMIAAFIAQGVATDDALKLAVYLHGAAGDALAKQGVLVGMTASEVTTEARKLLNGMVA